MSAPSIAKAEQSPSSQNETAILARGIIRDFEAGQSTIRVLHGIDTEIRSGELTYVVGESGSGKTTLISIMCGILWPTEGEVEVFGTDIYALSDNDLVEFRLNNIGFIFQQYNLIPSIDAAANAAVPLIAQGMAINEARERAKVLLDKLNIGDQADKLPSQLSGGQQQRVAIARALMQDPKIILADEPIASLDPMNAQVVMEALRRIHEEDGRMVIANLHTLDTARRYCDRVIGMRDGRIVFDGTPDQLTTGVARDIYGADASFSEEATSTSIEALERSDAAARAIAGAEATV